MTKRRAVNPWRRSGVPAPAGWVLVSVYGVAGVLIVLSSFWGWRGPYGTHPINGFVIAMCLAIAAAYAGRAARFKPRRQRYGWLALVTALLGWAAGEVIWAVYDVRPEFDHATHPAATEFVLLLWPVGAMTSLVLLSQLSRKSPRRLLLDGLIVATSLFVIAWVFVVEAQLQEHSGARLVTSAEVFADIVQVTTAILMLSRARPGDRPSRSLLAAGVATICIADMALVFYTGIASYHTGGVGDLVRVAGLALLALAALAAAHERPAPAPPDETEFRARLWLPYLPLILAAAAGWAHAAGHSIHDPMLAALGILVAAVLARQFVVLVDNQNLLSEVAREAFRDNLTGLANRALFLQRLEQAVARRHPNGMPIAVLCLDLDNFKAVNDALGHPAGDELLVRVAGRLTAALGESGTIARLGGDEFAAVIEASVQESQAAAHRILDAFTGAILIDGIPIMVRPSIGFTVCTGASACTVDQLLRHADLAMYAAKREGGQCIRSFMPDLPLPYAFPASPDSGESDVAPPVDVGGGAATPQASPPVSDAATPTTNSPSGDVSDDAPRPPRGIRMGFAVLAVGVIAFAASSVAHPGAGHGMFSATTLYSALTVLAAGLVVLRAYRVSADRLAWSLIAAGMAFSAAGDIVYALFVPNGRSPSVADPVYLAYYPLVYAGLLLLMRARFKRLPIPIQLDSLVCALTLAAVAAAVTEGPMRAATSRTPATVWMGLVYPWIDLVLLALAAGMLPILGWRNDFRWVLLMTGLVVFAVADVAYLFQTTAGSYRVGTLLDACWPASSLLIAMASWSASSPTAPVPRHRFSPYVTPVTTSVVALGVIVLAHHSRPAATLAALSLVVATARFSLTFRDVSLLHTNAKHAMTDELTALPNRHSLDSALTALPATAPGSASIPGRARARRALLLLSLSDFHEITDSIGRHFGDELLCHIANRLSGSVRRDDMLARVGDDQFAVLLADGANLTAASAQAGRLLEALSEPIALDPITVQVEGRIAIALCPDHCDHPQELLGRAETAMAHAESARSKIAVYDSSFEVYRNNDPNLIEDLRTALFDTDELKLHYQPKIDGRDGSVHSVEAVLRWQHPTRGTLLPEEVLPVAERAGLMRKISNRTLSMALKQVRCWREQGITLTVAVNLSTTNLLDIELVGTVERLLANYDLPADALILEITESALVDSARSRNTVAALQRLGIRISLDDYGTGWSSLARLQEVSVDELKLDRIFVTRLDHDARSVAIVRSTVALAHNLGADLVAEGVENEATLDALHRYGCMITQGYVHTAPLPPDELRNWIANHTPEPHTSQSHRRA